VKKKAKKKRESAQTSLGNEGRSQLQKSSTLHVRSQQPKKSNSPKTGRASPKSQQQDTTAFPSSGFWLFFVGGGRKKTGGTKKVDRGQAPKGKQKFGTAHDQVPKRNRKSHKVSAARKRLQTNIRERSNNLGPVRQIYEFFGLVFLVGVGGKKKT